MYADTLKRQVRRYARIALDEPAVKFGLFRRLKPISKRYGALRGKPIDRHFIEDFVSANRGDIKGRVLEGGGGYCYGRQFGTGVTQLDIMYPNAGYPDGTMIADLATGEGLETGVYDCLLLTQVYPFIYDVQGAVANSWRALRPGGVLLATLEGIAQTTNSERGKWGVFWRFTDMSAERLFGEHFGEENVKVTTYGNVFSACAFMQCLAADDLTERELSHRDQEYQVTICVRAVKPG